MRLSQEFKIELKKAIKLSTFISVVVFGMVLASYQKETDSSREIASMSEPTDEICPVDQNGKAIPNLGRSVPPFEKKPCIAPKK